MVLSRRVELLFNLHVTLLWLKLPWYLRPVHTKRPHYRYHYVDGQNWNAAHSAHSVVSVKQTKDVACQRYGDGDEITRCGIILERHVGGDGAFDEQFHSAIVRLFFVEHVRVTLH